VVRQYLLQAHRPAVVLIESLNLKSPDMDNLFYRSAENNHMVLAQYYDLPLISLRALAFKYAQEQRPGYRLDGTSYDGPDRLYASQNGDLAQASGHRCAAAQPHQAWRVADIGSVIASLLLVANALDMHST
jgi:hypothetical protein